MIELLEAKPQKKSQLKSETYFADLIKLLPPEHKARWLSGAAINNADQAALTRLKKMIFSQKLLQAKK